MYQIDITEYLENRTNRESFGVTSKEIFVDLMRQVEMKFSDSKIDWNSYMNCLSTGERNVYEIDLWQKNDKEIWSMIEHHEFISNTEIISFLRANTK